MTDIKVRVHPAESFINFMVNTKLYIRGERGKNWKEAEALRRELFHQLVPFFDRIHAEAKAEEREECAKLCESLTEYDGDDWQGYYDPWQMCADAIRKRGAND